MPDASLGIRCQAATDSKDQGPELTQECFQEALFAQFDEIERKYDDDGANGRKHPIVSGLVSKYKDFFSQPGIDASEVGLALECLREDISNKTEKQWLSTLLPQKFFVERGLTVDELVKSLTPEQKNISTIYYASVTPVLQPIYQEIATQRIYIIPEFVFVEAKLLNDCREVIITSGNSKLSIGLDYCVFYTNLIRDKNEFLKIEYFNPSALIILEKILASSNSGTGPRLDDDIKGVLEVTIAELKLRFPEEAAELR